jgi:hypothetical protein
VKHRRRTMAMRMITILAVALMGAGAVGWAGVARPVDAQSPVAAPAADAPLGSRANPAPMSIEVAAGPWLMTLTGVARTDEARRRVLAASEFNEPPRTGLAYIAALVQVVNTSAVPVEITPEDFGVTGDARVMRRVMAVEPPPTPLRGIVEPGATLEGWVVGVAGEEETGLVLVYDPLALSGSWADAQFALDDGAAYPDITEPMAQANSVGTTAGRGAYLTETVVTDDWVVTIQRVAWGSDVEALFPDDDYRTLALASADSASVDYWVAVLVEITDNQTGGYLTTISSAAIVPVDGNGQPIAGVGLLTPPDPDIAEGFYPGGTRRGWVVFEMPPGSGISVVRFLPMGAPATEARYFNILEYLPTPTPVPLRADKGQQVRTTIDEVRMRSEASTSGEIVQQMVAGTVLVVTGPKVTGGDYEWYPVEDPETGATGYVVIDFLELVPGAVGTPTGSVTATGTATP